MTESGAPSDPTGRGPPFPTPVRWTDDGRGIVVLDQTALPAAEVWTELTTIDGVEEAVRALRVRGAPLIGITAALAVAALATDALAEEPRLSADELASRVGTWCDRLDGARPTAVNLSWATARMRKAAAEGTAEARVERLRAEACHVLDEDRDACRRIGEHALALLRPESRVLTHCNAGALATGGIGTALAPIYLAHGRGWPVRVFVGETRPLLQGSRLTAWELARAGVDVTLLADDMAGALFARERPDVVLVGADRIAANGDVANKVGTYPLAVLARHHAVPFYVLAPTSTVDPATRSGAEIPIEFRSPDEIRKGFGALTAPEHVTVWSPAFDVTPAELVTGIVTEQGVARPPFEASLSDAVERGGRERAGAERVSPRASRLRGGRGA